MGNLPGFYGLAGLRSSVGQITLVGTATGAASNGGDVTVTFPGGVQQGDVVYAAYSVGHIGAFDTSVVSAGWTELADVSEISVSFDSHLGVFRKVMGAIPDTSVVFAGSGAADEAAAGAIIVLRGVDTSTPEDASTVTATGAHSTDADPPSITTVTAKAWVLAIGANTPNDTGAEPSGYSNFVERIEIETGTTGHILLASKEIAVAGAEDPGAYSGFTGTLGHSWCAATVAVRPA